MAARGFCDNFVLALRFPPAERKALAARSPRIAGTVSDLAAAGQGFPPRRLPRLSRLEARSDLLFTGQAGVGQALADDAGSGPQEAQAVIQLAGVEPEDCSSR